MWGGYWQARQHLDYYRVVKGDCTISLQLQGVSSAQG